MIYIINTWFSVEIPMDTIDPLLKINQSKSDL